MDLNLDTLLKECADKKGSDLHIAAFSPPRIRVDGSLVTLEHPELKPEDTKELCYSILSPAKQKRLETELEMDLSFTFQKRGRVRANIFYQQDTVAGAFRIIPLEIPKAEDVGIPQVIIELTHKPRGLILVTGPTGSGKSTTLATMLDNINKNRSDHIITVEDPIEYLYHHDKCLIDQREIGSDTKSFQQALKYILRQDPDVVLVGEMRDLETIQSAITVAETGHLVLATLHTNSAVQTIDRIIDVFPPYHQPQVRAQLAFILEGVICQQLVPKIGGGRTLSLEIMMPTQAIRTLIREGKTHQIYAQMQMGQEASHMLTLNQSLAALVNRKIISYEEGLFRCVDREEFATLLAK